MKVSVKKNKSGTYSVVIRDALGRERWVKTRATQKDEINEIVKGAEIKKITMAAETGLLRDNVASILTSGTKLKCADAIPLYLDSLRKTGKAPTTIDQTEITLKQWMRRSRTAKVLVASVTEDMIDRFINENDGTKIATRKSRLCLLFGFFDWMMECGYRTSNPAGRRRVAVDMRKLSHEQKEPANREAFTEDEYLRIIKNTTGFWLYATMFSYWTGMRLVDICTLEWSQFTGEQLIAWTRKSGTRVALNLQSEHCGNGALIDLLSVMPLTDYNYMFPKQREMAIDPKKRYNLSANFKYHVSSLGIKGKSFHCLRHSFAQRLQKNGVRLEDISRLIGHRNEETTKTYTK